MSKAAKKSGTKNKSRSTKKKFADARTAEAERLANQKAGDEDWQSWGPYLSERQWGTVREDYSQNGTAWDSFPHDMARSRAYRWGEDGIAGLSDREQRLCLGLALWNGQDPILKERIFGLTNSEGNHGEDVKDYYYYQDATPTHSYLKMLYKYPHAAFPYGQLVEENRNRGMDQPEYELIDTGVFDDNRYFDVTVEYAQASPRDILMRVTAVNRGPDAALLHIIPQCWARNTWSWGDDVEKPKLEATSDVTASVEVPGHGDYTLHIEDSGTMLFCDNESNARRLWGQHDAPGCFKDAFHEYVVDGREDAVSSARQGTKAGAHHVVEIAGGGTAEVRLRLRPKAQKAPFSDFDRIMEGRRQEADEFYADLQQDIDGEDRCHVQRQALAGMIWTKQFFYYDVARWLNGDPGQFPPPEGRRHGRNWEWQHLNNADIISMPDKWEYPWYAAWDLAFHCVPLAVIDPEFAKQQLLLLTREWYMHPNGQLPAYEWAFGDVNPPVHAWATWRVYTMDQNANGGVGDHEFLERVFHKLMLNFTWWVNRKDAEGHNIFQGGFLGLDNIGVFDRSAPLPTSGFINQSDGTSWMAMYSLNLMRIALELALENPVYEDIATKFFEHFLHIAEAMNNIGDRGIGLWDEQDQFFYDELVLPDGNTITLRVRSMVGLIPLFAVEVLDPELLEKLPNFAKRLHWYLDYRPELAELVAQWDVPGKGHRHLLALLREDKLKAVIERLVDETEFLSDYGVRALSRYHADNPYVFDCLGTRMSVEYVPAESTSGLFGGNSNWRGPIWFPVNFLLIESLQRFHHYCGDDVKIECPKGSGQFMTIGEIADELSERLCRIFLKDEDGRRPVYGHHPQIQNDPNFADHVLFYEYFHGDTGRGVGANHQTGWTGCVAKLLQSRQIK
jgi:hypothetical protein